jgi:hypothetical protein
MNMRLSLGLLELLQTSSFSQFSVEAGEALHRCSSKTASVAPFLSPEITGEICQCWYDEKTALAVFQLHLVQLPPQLESSNLILQAGVCQRYPLAKKQRIGKLFVRI